MRQKRKLAVRPAWRSELSSGKITCLLPVDLRRPLLSGRHIRLLKLYPPGWPDQLDQGLLHDQDPDLRCDVYQASLDDLRRSGRPAYAALSYVWGDPAPARRIRCGARSIGVTSNLYNALLYVRFLDRPRLIWVDSLCINQRDIAEKSAQVRMMHYIFAEAHVTAWIAHGGDPTHLQITFGLLREVDNALAQYNAAMESGSLGGHMPSIFAPDGERGKRLRTYLDAHRRQFLAKNPQLVLENACDYVAQILTAPYFQRIWVVQELALGKSRCLQVGTQMISVDLFRRASEALFRLCASDGPNGVHRDEAVNNFNDYLADTALPPGMPHDITRAWSPRTFVWSHRARLCQDPRDHIYGLSSLFPRMHASKDYKVDYTATVAEVFCDFTVYCLHLHGDLDVFSVARHRPRRPTKLGSQMSAQSRPEHKCEHSVAADLPSWCPRWDLPDRSFLSFFSIVQEDDSITTLGLWQADGGRGPAFRRVTSGSISIRGLELSLVTSRSPHRLCWSEDKPTFRIIDWLQRMSYEIEGQTQLQHLCMSFVTVLMLEAWTVYRDIAGLLRSSQLDSLMVSFSKEAHYRAVLLILAAICLCRRAHELSQRAGLAVPQSITRHQEQIIREAIERRVRFEMPSPRRLFHTDRGMLGSGPPDVRPGDKVCVLYGGQTPFILRPVDNCDRYRLVGQCFVDGLMYGEGTKLGLKTRDFMLV